MNGPFFLKVCSYFVKWVMGGLNEYLKFGLRRRIVPRVQNESSRVQN